jgi:hypothetical protein
MSEERKKVLEMLAAGKITAEDAEKFLDKLTGAAATSSVAAEPPSLGVPPTHGATKPKYLRIVVDHPGHDQVNMRVPLALVGSGKSLLAMMPKQLNERLAEYGINAGTFTAMTSEDLNQTIREINIDVVKNNGKKVRVYCE